MAMMTMVLFKLGPSGCDHAESSPGSKREEDLAVLWFAKVSFQATHNQRDDSEKPVDGAVIPSARSRVFRFGLRGFLLEP
jgi:hypothetical protein